MNSALFRREGVAAYTRGLRAPSLPGCFLAVGLGICPPVVSQSLRATGVATGYLCARLQFACGGDHIVGRHRMAVRPNCRKPMPKTSLVSIVEDDRYFRDSMGRLMRSLGYNVEAFSSAANFLASPRLIETTCLVADVHMPAMTGIELHKHLIETGYTIPTILVTAYPDDVERARALNDGVVCYLRKPVDEQDLIQCLRAALESAEPGEKNP
jgi:CheY-like chemotaxis protein